MDLLEVNGSVSVVSGDTIGSKGEVESYVTLNSVLRQRYPLHQTEDFISCPADAVRVEVDLPDIYIRVPEGHGFQLYDQVVVDNIRMHTAAFSGVSVTVGSATLSWSVPNSTPHSLLVENVPHGTDISLPMTVSSFNISTGFIPYGAVDGKQSVIVNVTDSTITFGLSSASQRWPPVAGSVLASFVLANAHVGGIPLEQIQSNLPLDESHAMGSKTVYGIGLTWIRLQSTDNAKFSVLATGGSGVYTAKIVSETRGFAQPSSYYQSLDRTYSKVSKIRLIATEFPCSVVNVDGSSPFTYEGASYPFLTVMTVYPPRGAYTPERLVSVIVELMNQKETTYVDEKTGVTRRRVFYYKSNRPACNIDCRVLVTIPSSSLTLNKDIRRAQFAVSSHGLRVGDIVMVPGSSASDAYGYPVTILSDSANVPDPDNFQIQVSPRLVDEWKTKSYVDLELPGYWRVMSSTRETLLSILGFASTSDKSFTTSIDTTVPPQVWPFPYFELRTRPDQPVDGVTPVSLASDFLLGRVRLDVNKVGKTLVDYHTWNWEKVFIPYLDSISGLNVFLLWPDGTMPDFNGADHVFTLSVMESQQSKGRLDVGLRRPVKDEA